MICVFFWVLACQLVWLVPCQGVSRELFPTHSAQWVLPPEEEPEDAYFGYSVAFEPTRKRLLVSAPNHDEVGEIYSYDLNSNSSPDSNYRKTVPQDKSLDKFVERPHKYWFGAVLKAGPTYFVACAPRYLENKTVTIMKQAYKNRFKEVLEERTLTLGQCFKYTDPFKEATILKSIPYEERDNTPGVTRLLYENWMDSFGWSIDIAGDDIMIGSPAQYTGRAMKIDAANGESTPVSLTGYRGTERLVEYSYGYSIVSGYFKIDSDAKTRIYAIGSPYGTEGRGKVIFTEYKPTSQSMSYALELGTDGVNVVGSMFGATLCAARLTHDSHATALLVGAPTHANASTYQYNRGAVYFYRPAHELPLERFYIRIDGKKDNSYFGSAILNIGDFNGDGMDEVAISAPHEDDGVGAVYIYSSTDINTDKDTRSMPIQYVQRITPESRPDLTTSIQSFGLSLAIQNNEEKGCNELAIGAPHSNKVMVLNCAVFVTIKIQEPVISALEDRATPDAGEFIFRSCFIAEFPEKPKTITTTIKLVVRLLNRKDMKSVSTIEYDEPLDRNKLEYCHDEQFTALKMSYELPIKYDITASEHDLASSTNALDLSRGRVLFGDNSELQKNGSIWLPNDCKDRENCTPRLVLNNIYLPETYALGSSQSIELQVSVSNKGEVAYSACVRFFLHHTDVVAVPSGCERNNEDSAALVCRPSMPLRDQPWVLPKILLQTSHLTSDNTNITANIGLYDHCTQESKWPSNKTISLTTDSDVKIKGVTDSGPDNEVIMTRDDVDGKAFEHSYTIINVGMTHWVNVPAILVVPTRSFVEYSPIIILSASKTGGEQESNCQVKKKNAGSVTYACTIEQVYKNPVRVTVPMMIKYGMLEDGENKNQSTQLSSITLDFHGKIIRASVKSTLHYKSVKVAIWIIVVAALVGLILLTVICFLLSKCGFFKRQKNVELKEKRESVRRQTITRQTMRNSMLTPIRQSLITNLQEVSAEEAAANDHRLRLDTNHMMTRPTKKTQ